MTATNRAGALDALRRIEQGLAEMIGLVRGVIAYGKVTDEEAQHLCTGTRVEPESANGYQANDLSRPPRRARQI